MWEASGPRQGHQQADKYSIPIPTLPCKAKNKFNSKQTIKLSSALWLRGVSDSRWLTGLPGNVIIKHAKNEGIGARCSILLGPRFKLKCLGEVEAGGDPQHSQDEKRG